MLIVSRDWRKKEALCPRMNNKLPWSKIILSDNGEQSSFFGPVPFERKKKMPGTQTRESGTPRGEEN